MKLRMRILGHSLQSEALLSLLLANVFLEVMEHSVDSK